MHCKSKQVWVRKKGRQPCTCRECHFADMIKLYPAEKPDSDKEESGAQDPPVAAAAAGPLPKAWKKTKGIAIAATNPASFGESEMVATASSSTAITSVDLDDPLQSLTPSQRAKFLEHVKMHDAREFSQYVLGFNRYATELLKKMDESTETITDMKIEVLASWRGVVKIGFSFSDQFYFGLIDEEGGFPALKETVPSKEIQTVVQRFIFAIRKYQECTERYENLHQAACDAQVTFFTERSRCMMRPTEEGYGLDTETYQEMVNKRDGRVTKYETLILFAGDAEARLKVLISLKVFDDLVDQLEKEVVAARNFFDSFKFMLKRDPKELNAGRAFEKKIYEMELKFMEQAMAFKTVKTKDGYCKKLLKQLELLEGLQVGRLELEGFLKVGEAQKCELIQLIEKIGIVAGSGEDTAGGGHEIQEETRIDGIVGIEESSTEG